VVSVDSSRGSITRHWWIMPVILATQEAEIRRIGFKVSPGKIRTYLENIHHKKGWRSGSR
jgi:hypothetical protein